MSKIALSGNASGTGTFTIASPNSNSDRTLNLPDAAGTLTVASSGTPDATTFLRGDGAWATISTTPTTAQVLTATAGATVGAVGTYAWCQVDTGVFNQNDTTTGSNLRGLNDTTIINPSFSGTWRNMGAMVARSGATRTQSLWLRIS